MSTAVAERPTKTAVTDDFQLLSRPPEAQYMKALKRANQVRLARAALKNRIAATEIEAAAVILDCPWEAENMAVADLLISQRRWGQTRMRKFLSKIPMSEKKTIGSLTERQRKTLAAMLKFGTEYEYQQPADEQSILALI